MADTLTLQSAGLVRQKAYNAVYGSGTGTTTNTVSPYHFYAIKSFFLYWAANKGNLDLQFIPYTAEQATTNAGYNPDIGPSTLYVWFAKARRTSGTTAAFETLLDGASSGDSDAVTTQISVNRIRATGDQFITVWPTGFALATDLTIASTTTLGGATESSAANSSDGFVIVGT